MHLKVYSLKVKKQSLQETAKRGSVGRSARKYPFEYNGGILEMQLMVILQSI